MSLPHGKSLAQAKERVLTQVKATFAYMPDDPEAASQLISWLEWQVAEILDMISLDDFEPAELMAVVGVIGPVFARALDMQSTARSAQRRTSLRLL